MKIKHKVDKVHFGGLAIGSLFKNSVGSYSTEGIEQLHMNMNSQALQNYDMKIIIVVIIHTDSIKALN